MSVGGGAPARRVTTLVLLGGAMVVAAIAATFAWVGVARRAWAEAAALPGVERAVDVVASRTDTSIDALRSLFLAPPVDLVAGAVGGLVALAVVLVLVVVGRLAEDALDAGRDAPDVTAASVATRTDRRP